MLSQQFDSMMDAINEQAFENEKEELLLHPYVPYDYRND
jgi:hypothetical protein